MKFKQENMNKIKENPPKFIDISNESNLLALVEMNEQFTTSRDRSGYHGWLQQSKVKDSKESKESWNDVKKTLSKDDHHMYALIHNPNIVVNWTTDTFKHAYEYIKEINTKKNMRRRKEEVSSREDGEDERGI
jgi:hypothetical protein